MTVHQKYDPDEGVNYRDDVPSRIDYNMLPEKKVFNTVYSDEIFFKPSNTYHHLLAKQSCGLALAAFNLLSKEEDHDPEGRGTLSDYLKTTGFVGERIDDYNRETSMYTVASAIASKDIEYNGEYARLIVVAIRGGNYENEWQSNFSLGDGARHKGFDEAATVVTDRVVSYFAARPSSYQTKIWITGFSRAGAIANLVAANLNELPFFDKEQIFAYTFAAPAAINASDFDVLTPFDNIFNILGASDLIPQFVPMEWGFDRYGVDMELVGTEFDPTFDFKYQAIQKQLEELGGKTYYVPELNFRLRMLYGLLLEFSSSQQVFVELLQPVFISLMQSTNVNTILEILRETLIKYDAFSKATAEQKDVIIDYVLSLLQPILTGSSFMKGQLSTVVVPFLGVVHEHLPELYLHLLYSYDPKDLYTEVRHFDYVVLDDRHYTLVETSSGKELLTVERGVKTLSQYAKDNHLDYSVFTNTRRPVLVLPHDRSYRLDYHLNAGETLSAFVVPYGRYFVSALQKYETNIGGIAPREGTLLTITPEGANYYVTPVEYRPSQFNADLGIERLGVSYHVYILLLGLMIAIILIAVMWLAVLTHTKITKTKFPAARLGILSLLIAFAVEAEIMFWFSSNLWLYNVLFKVGAALCVVALYLLGRKMSQLKRIDKTVLPALVLFAANYVFASLNMIVTLSLAIAGAIYLSIYHLRLARPGPHLWIVYALTTVLGIPLVALFIGAFGVNAILYLCLLPFLLLSGFTAIPLGTQKKAATFLWIAQMCSLGVYLFSLDGGFAASIMFVVFGGLSMVMFALNYDALSPSSPSVSDAPELPMDSSIELEHE